MFQSLKYIILFLIFYIRPASYASQLLLLYLSIRMDVLHAIIMDLIYWRLVLTFTRNNSRSEVKTLLSLISDILNLYISILMRKILLFINNNLTFLLQVFLIAKVRFPWFHLQSQNITVILNQLTRWTRLLNLRRHCITTLFIRTWIYRIETQLTHAGWRWKDLRFFEQCHWWWRWNLNEGFL